MNIQSCVCVTPWEWRGVYWIQGTLYEIADQTYCQDTVLELCWQHWKWEITQISICEEDNQQCNISLKVSLELSVVMWCKIVGSHSRVQGLRSEILTNENTKQLIEFWLPNLFHTVSFYHIRISNVCEISVQKSPS